MMLLPRRSGVFALSTLAILSGCSGAETSGTDGEPTYVRDIQPLLETKCAGCHTEGGIAPFALDTYEQAKGAKGAIRTAVVDKVMPPWLADNACTDYAGDRSLTEAQIDAIVRWVDGDAPMGDPGDTPVKVEDTRTTLSRVDLELPLPEAYTPQTAPDDYHCFFLDWPATETTYVTGFGVEPGNPSIVHHVIAYVVPPEKVAVFQALEDASPEQGWTCFGGPGGEGPADASWIGAWVPGLSGQDFPEGTGIQMPAGSKVVVQMHYNSQGASSAPDQTKILVRTDATVEKRAAIMPMADPLWITAGTMTIPAHSQDVVHEITLDPAKFVPFATGGALSGDNPLTVHDVGLHMHTLGKRGGTRIEHADGSTECLLEVPRWDFNWQGNYTLATPRLLAPGDKLHLECQWDNPRDMDVSWGEGTSDEMCLGLYYLTD